MKLINKFKNYTDKIDFKSLCECQEEIYNIEKEAKLSEAQTLYLNYKYPKRFRLRGTSTNYEYKWKEAIKEHIHVRLVKYLRKMQVKDFYDFIEGIKGGEIWKIRAFVEQKYGRIIL